MPLEPIKGRLTAPEFLSAVPGLSLGRRICVYGHGGKTTLSAALGDHTGLQVIELDAISWLPNWVERDRDELREIVLERIHSCPDGWIVDGNYSQLRQHLLPLSDTVIWLHLPRIAMTLKIVKRTVLNAIRGTKICGDNYESLLKMWCPDSIIWYKALKSGGSHRRIAEELSEMDHDACVYEIRSYSELNELYDAFSIDRKRYLI